MNNDLMEYIEQYKKTNDTKFRNEIYLYIVENTTIISNIFYYISNKYPNYYLLLGFSETDKEEELIQEINLNLLDSIEKLSLDKLKEKNEKEVLKFITYYTINLITTKIINKIKKQNTFPSQYYKLIKLIGYIPNIKKLLNF
jgi:hypothetical protein